jgi:outer membrane beta-barrel protein
MQVSGGAWKTKAKRWGSRLLLAITAMSLGPMPLPVAQANESERFRDTEIRVIRPRYFTKSQRFELGGALNTIMNESFIYTFLATGIATFHFNEEFAIEGSFSYGISIDREDKRILFDEFDIKTQIFRTQYLTELALQWTPVYGKWQLASGRLIYFDTFVMGGVGQTGIEWRYDDFCEPPDRLIDPTAESIPSNTVKSYPTFMAGIGQRYFVSRTVSYRWDLRAHRFLYNEIDGECSPIKAKQQQSFASNAPHDSITLLLGVSRYF